MLKRSLVQLLLCRGRERDVERLHAKLRLNVLIVSASGGQKAHFGQILTFWGFLYRLPFTHDGQMWCTRADPRSTLTRQISSECVHCACFRWPKTSVLEIFDTLGDSCTGEAKIWCARADPRYMLMYQISYRSVYSVALWWQNPQISWCRQLAAI